jgi:hypothetical protein
MRRAQTSLTFKARRIALMVSKRGCAPGEEALVEALSAQAGFLRDSRDSARLSWISS